MKIKNWEKFNEMDAGVYRRAAKKLKDNYPGTDPARIKRLQEHPAFLMDLEEKERERESLELYKDIEPFKFSSKGINFTGRYIGTSPGMTMDMWIDNEKQIISIAPYFIMEDEDGNSHMISPFWIEKNNDDDKVFAYGPFNVEESPWGETFDEGGDEPILLTTRKDANRLLNILKSDYNDINAFNSRKWKPGEKQEFMSMYRQLLDKTNPKLISK
jgi:hypothetical protein